MKKTIEAALERLWRSIEKRLGWGKPNDKPGQVYPWRGTQVLDGGNPGSSHIKSLSEIEVWAEHDILTGGSLDRSRINLNHAGSRPPWGNVYGDVAASIALVYLAGDKWYFQGFAGWCPEDRFSRNPAWFAADEIGHHGGGLHGSIVWACLTKGTRNRTGGGQRSNWVKIR